MAHPKAVVWYVGPTYKQTKLIAWQELKALIPREALYRKNEADLNLQVKNSAQLYLMGADEPDSLRGPDPTFVVCEEAAMWKHEAWHNVIRPNLAPHKAPALFIGNPKGLNWYYDLWANAEKDPENWGLHHYTIHDNPHIEPGEIEQCRQDCPNDAVWRQEYLAEFESEAGRVFIFDQDAIFTEVAPPAVGQLSYRGIDWGQRDDTACIWGYIKGGRLNVFREHAQSGLPASQQAKLIYAKSEGLTVDSSVISHDAWRQDPEMEGITVAWHFIKAGISPLRNSGREKRAARDMLQKLLSEKRISIDPMKCPVLRRQLTKLEWKDTRLEQTEDGDDDAVDALHYLVFMLATRLLLQIEKTNVSQRDPKKLYLPERNSMADARFSSMGDVI